MKKIAGDIVPPPPPGYNPDSKFWKNEKNAKRYHYFKQLHQKSWWYALLFLRYGVRHVIFIFHFKLFFALWTPNSPKNKNKNKQKKPPGDTIILHMSTKSHNQMMYGSWDLKCNRQTDSGTEKVAYRGECPN